MKDENLANDDKEIWEKVTETVTPLGSPKKSFKTGAPVISFRDVMEQIQFHESPKIKKNRNRYDAKLDLHGMTRNEAHHALEIFLCKEKMRGSRRVLVITGKGHGKGEGLGILKRKVPLWLELSKIVHSWSIAAPQDGGDGALYVYLK